MDCLRGKPWVTRERGLNGHVLPASAVVADNVSTQMGEMPKGVPPRRSVPNLINRAEDAAVLKPAKGNGTGQEAKYHRAQRR